MPLDEARRWDEAGRWIGRMARGQEGRVSLSRLLLAAYTDSFLPESLSNAPPIPKPSLFHTEKIKIASCHLQICLVHCSLKWGF